jgi:hypothetical protein
MAIAVNAAAINPTAARPTAARTAIVSTVVSNIRGTLGLRTVRISCHIGFEAITLKYRQPLW